MRRRTPPQKRISESLARFNVACFGRQSGKTTYGLDKMIYKPIQGRDGGIYWYVLQTSSAAEVAFNRYWDMTKDSGLLLKKPNESEKFFTLINGATVFFKSGEVYNNLRAETLDGCIIDEVRQQKRDLWAKIIRPMLAKRKGWCDFLSTSNGFDHFYDLFEYARKDQTGEWAAFQARSSEAWWWTPEEIESARATMSEGEFKQEILAEFINLTTGLAYKSYGAHNKVTANPFANKGEKWSKYLPIVVGMDFNVNPMSWILGQHKPGSGIYWGEEIYLTNSNTEEATLELVTRIQKHKPGVIIIGDATGKARKSSSAGKTDYDIATSILQAHSIPFQNLTPTENPLVKDRVNTMNARFKAANGTVSMWVDINDCPRLNKDCERVVWKEGASNALEKKADPTLTHMSDAAGYPVCVLMPLEGVNDVGVLRRINRG